MKHTPGPWAIRPNGHPGQPSIYPANGNHYTPTIAVVSQLSNHPAIRHPETDANAKLIAAAPDLLAALVAIVVPGGTMNSESRWQAAADAIQAATGQSLDEIHT